MAIENVTLVQEELEALELAHKQARLGHAIPTLDVEICEWLRRYGEPIKLFGENKGQRRTRLRYIFVQHDSQAPPPPFRPPPAMQEAETTTKAPSQIPSADGIVEMTIDDIIDQSAGQTDVFYTEGSASLVNARREITKQSLTVALTRNYLLKAQRFGSREEDEEQATRRRARALASTFDLAHSRVGSNRPICTAKYAPLPPSGSSDAACSTADVLAIGGWSGEVSCWQGPDRLLMGNISTHIPQRIHSVAWRPNCPVSTSPCAVLATGSSTGAVTLSAIIAEHRPSNDFSGVPVFKGSTSMSSAGVSKADRMTDGSDGEDDLTSDAAAVEALSHVAKPFDTLSNERIRKEEICKFDTCEDRITKVVWHPFGNYLFASCIDSSWRMYDIARATELVVQEGHSMDVFSLAAHPDGSLVASGDAGGVIRLWDLRTGISVMALEGHQRKVLSLDFHPFNGSSLLSSGEDCTALVWDLRRRDVHSKLLEHTKLVSQAMYDETGDVAVTCGYDGIVKVWETARYDCLKNLVAQRSLIMGIDLRHHYAKTPGAASGQPELTAAVYQPELAMVNYDRLLKIWRPGGL